MTARSRAAASPGCSPMAANTARCAATWRPCQAASTCSTSGKYLYSVARPIPAAVAICDMVTASRPRRRTSSAAASMMASRTSARWAWTVSAHNCGMNVVYSMSIVIQNAQDKTVCHRAAEARTGMAEPMPQEGDQAEPERAGTGAGRPGMPRWVKTLGIVAAALLLLLLIVMLASGGQHGPGRHRPSSLGLTAAAAPSAIVADAAQ